MKALALAYAFLFSFSSYAQVEVSFLELRDWQGELIYLEPGFPYAHVAISENDRGYWHAHPVRGVEQVSEAILEKVGRIALKFEVPAQETLDGNLLRKFNEKAYDGSFSWSDAQIYCSELVAKLLGVPPQPMHFDPELWPAKFQALEGKPGISPGGIYRWLVQRNAKRYLSPR